MSGPDRIHVMQVLGNAILGGMERWVERLLTHLPAERYRHSALLPFEGQCAARLRALGAEVWVASIPDDPPWSTLATAMGLVNSTGVDLIHAHLPRAHVLAGLVGRLTSTPVLSTIHGRQLSTVDLEVQRACGSHLSVVCHQTYFHALGLGVDPRHLSCETNGVDTTRFRPRPRPESGLRSTLDLSANAIVIGFVGRLSPEKGPDVLLRALALLHRDWPDVHVVFIGEGPMACELKALADRMGLRELCHWIGARQNMEEMYGEFDVFVSSSHTEAMPLAVMEAMASGLPVIATQVGGVPEIVEQGQSGWLVPAGDFHAIALRVTELLEQPSLRAAMGSAARDRAVTHMDLSASVARVDQLLTQLATKKPLLASLPSLTGGKSLGNVTPSTLPTARRATARNNRAFGS